MSGHRPGVLGLTLAQLERGLFGETHRPQSSCRIAVFLAAVPLVPVRRSCSWLPCPGTRKTLG